MTANMEFTNFIEIYLTFYLKDDVWDITKDQDRSSEFAKFGN